MGNRTGNHRHSAIFQKLRMRAIFFRKSRYAVALTGLHSTARAHSNHAIIGVNGTLTAALQTTDIPTKSRRSSPPARCSLLSCHPTILLNCNNPTTADTTAGNNPSAKRYSSRVMRKPLTRRMPCSTWTRCDESCLFSAFCSSLSTPPRGFLWGVWMPGSACTVWQAQRSVSIIACCKPRSASRKA